MKLSDEHRKKLIDWIENGEYLPFQQMQFKCLIQLLDESEQVAWEEVDRLKEENKRLKQKIGQLKENKQVQTRYILELQERSYYFEREVEQFEEENKRLKSLLDDMLSEMRYTTRAIDAKDVVSGVINLQRAIERIEEEIK